MTGKYHLGPDGDCEQTLWWGDDLHGDDPVNVASINTTPTHQWDLLVIGAGLHDDFAVIPRELLADIAEDARVAAVDVDDDPANGVWAVRNLRDRLAGLASCGWVEAEGA